MAIDQKWCNETTILLPKKSRNLRGAKKVEARDVASPNFPLEGNYMTATPQGIGELGANLVRIFKQCVGNFCWEMHTGGRIKDVKAFSFEFSMFTWFWDWGIGDVFLDSVSKSQDIPGFFRDFQKLIRNCFLLAFNPIHWPKQVVLRPLIVAGASTITFLTFVYLAKYYWKE